MSRHLIAGLSLLCALGVPEALWAQPEHDSNQARQNKAHFSSLASEYWALDHAEVQRVESLVNIERAFSQVDRLTPFELLGKYAESDAERRHYAERYATAMADHQRRSLRWAVSVTTVLKAQEQGAQQALLSDPLIAAYLRSVGPSRRPASAPRWHLHVPATPCAECAALVDASVTALEQGAIEGLDVIFIGMDHADEPAVIDWVQASGFSSDDIRGNRITVNIDSEAWRRERAGRDEPVLLDGLSGLPAEY